MLPYKKIALLFLTLVLCRPILGMVSIRQHFCLFARTSKQTFHFHTYPINTKPIAKDLSDEKLEQFLRNNYLSPKNLPFALTNIGKVTFLQIEALSEFKKRQQNKDTGQRKRNRIAFLLCNTYFSWSQYFAFKRVPLLHDFDNISRCMVRRINLN